MDYEFTDADLLRLATELDFSMGFPVGVEKAFRMRVQSIQAARHTGDLAAIRGHRYEQLKGKRSHEYSIRLNDQFRLIFELRDGGNGKVLVITGIEDYH